jgi:protein arginine kinase activator
MLCNVCNKNQATIHLEGFVNGKSMFLHLCEDCASSKGFNFNATKQNFSLVDLLANLSDWEIPGHKSLKTVTCPNCGLSYTKFKETARLGCPKCYDTFALQLTPLLKRIHGSCTHKGRSPKTIVSESSDKTVSDLKKELKAALEKEDYEKAAELRDRIKDINRQ